MLSLMPSSPCQFNGVTDRKFDVNCIILNFFGNSWVAVYTLLYNLTLANIFMWKNHFKMKLNS